MGSWPVVGCVEWWACHSVLAQFPWDTDTVTEVCMTGFCWETRVHTSEGRKEVELGRGLLPCSVLEARPELSPQGGLGAGGWAQWLQRRGAGSRSCLTASPPHSGFSGVFWEGEYQTHRLTVVKILEIPLWITYSFSVSLSC